MMSWEIDYREPRHPDEPEIYVVKYLNKFSDKFYFRSTASGQFELFDVIRNVEGEFQQSKQKAAEKLFRQRNLDAIVDENGDVLVKIVRGGQND